ncbi:MAG: hypothetical protein QNK33_02270, partial [Bacteroidales bacterium]|nr:hypothetical protein [Bacteroidales bacterium]
MKNILVSALLLISSFIITNAQQLTLDSWLLKSPEAVNKPMHISGPDITGHDYETKALLTENYIDISGLKPMAGDIWRSTSLAKDNYISIKALRRNDYQIAYLATYIESDGLNKIKIEVESPQMFEVYLDGKKISSNYSSGDDGKSVKRSGTLDLDQGKFLVLVKTLYSAAKKDDWKIRASLQGLPESGLTVSNDPFGGMNIHHLLEGPKLGSMSISPAGKYVIVNFSETEAGSGKSRRWSVIKNIDGKIVQSYRKAASSGYSWMPSGNKLYYTEKSGDYTSIMVNDLDKGEEYAITGKIKDMSGFSWSDDCSFIIYNIREKEKPGPKSSLKYMDDLGNRAFSSTSINHLYKYDIASGISQRLTFGKPGASLNDISPDGLYIVYSSSRPNPTQRPFSLQNMYLMDLGSGEVKTLWEDFRWGGYAKFSPDGLELLVSGGPDCFGDVGLNIGDQKIANNYDGQLYIYSIATGDIDPITTDFNPAVGSATWHPVDNKIYISASDEVYTNLFAWNKTDRQFLKINTIPANISGFNMAKDKLV